MSPPQFGGVAETVAHALAHPGHGVGRQGSGGGGAAGDHPQPGREGPDGAGVTVRAAAVVDERRLGRDGDAVLVQHRAPVGGAVGRGAARGGLAGQRLGGRGGVGGPVAEELVQVRHAGHVRVDDRVVRGEVAGTAEDPEGGQPAASRAAGVLRATGPARGAPGARAGRASLVGGRCPDGGPQATAPMSAAATATLMTAKDRRIVVCLQVFRSAPWSPAGLPLRARLVFPCPPGVAATGPVVAQPQRCHATATSECGLSRDPVARPCPAAARTPRGR